MSMLNLLKKLFKAAGGTFGEPQPTASKPKRKPAAKKTTSKKPAAAKSAASKRKSTASHSAQVYGSEAIFANPAAVLTPVPAQIRQMRSLSGYDNLTGQRSMEQLFYQQGKYMENYTDDYAETVQCGRSTPMYYNMKDPELRAYFTWRTRYRQGMLPAAQNAFLMLYTYEILNLIGFTSSEQAYDALGRLFSDYGETYPQVRKSLLRWIPDFAAFYHLPYRLDNPREAAQVTILRHSSHSAEELLLALDLLSKYHIKDSKLYLAEPEKVADLLKAVYVKMLMHYAENKNASFSSYLLGEQRREEYIMFEGAVFLFRSLQPDGDYRLSPLCVYHCCKGNWARETFCSDPHSDRIGAFLRTFDSLLREKLHFKSKLKQGVLPAGETEIIRDAIDSYFEEQKRKNAPIITLNEEELDRIRLAAEHTTDMLTLPEDAVQEASPAAQPEPEQEPEDDNDEIPDLPLSAPAMALLICLMTGESYQPLVDAGQMLSVLADEINENLYDQIGDTVIEMQDDDTPVLIEDYLDDLKGMLET
ncbi:MAG: TerB N-terminal domain-containing protein [Oscillospiraceae bacterium]|nr:TerB N-terminal domain-containing protein [Oscillospiraceae bacterium]